MSINLVKSVANGGTLCSQIFIMVSIFKYIGIITISNNIKQMTNAIDNNFCIPMILFAAYCLIICGLMDIVMFEMKREMAELTCVATPLAALRATPKN